LKEEERTKDLFLWLDSTSPETARQVFDSAEPALIQAKEYRLCGKYLDPDRAFKRLAELYRETQRMANDPAGRMQEYAKELEEHSNKSFANGAATLVALLVINDRQADAERIAAEALRESDGPALKEALSKALKGEIPPRWP
jgi:TPP-dependent pyruvate/acetoin dehydrogenase alpha subunit